MDSCLPATTTLSDPSLEAAEAWTDPGELCGLCGFEPEIAGYDPHCGVGGRLSACMYGGLRNDYTLNRKLHTSPSRIT